MYFWSDLGTQVPLRVPTEEKPLDTRLQLPSRARLSRHFGCLDSMELQILSPGPTFYRSVPNLGWGFRVLVFMRGRLKVAMIQGLVVGSPSSSVRISIATKAPCSAQGFCTDVPNS